MPKINIKEANARSDKADTARLRAIGDLLEVENNQKMYINQKKQLQQLIIHLYNLDFYVDKFTIFEVI